MPNRYATLDQATSEMEAQSIKPDTYKYLWQALEFVSSRIERETHLEFAPRLETRYFDAVGDHVLRSNLIDVLAGQSAEVKSPLLSITSVTLGGDDSPLPTTAYQEHPRGVSPITQIELIDGDAWTTFDTSPYSAIAITGLWGYRTRYPTDGWKLADSLTAAIANTTVETFSVSDADAVVGYGMPRFSPGMLLRTGATVTSEMRHLYAISSNTLSATRADNGSSAATQAQDTGIYIWQPEPAIQRAAIRWVSYLAFRRGKFVSASYDGIATEQFPADMPDEVRNILEDGGFMARQHAPMWRAI